MVESWDELKRRAKAQEAGTAGGNGHDPDHRELPLEMFQDIHARLDIPLLVEGLIGPEQFVILYGESNSGKSFVSIDLGMSLARGIDWLGRRCEQGPVLYIGAEGAFGIRNRIAAYKLAYGLEDATPPFVLVPAPVDLLRPDADAGLVIDAARKVATKAEADVKLIVVDTLSRAIAGGNENSSEDMGALVRNADRIREASRATILFVHHSGKDTAKGARGHSLLRAACDVEAEVTKDETKLTAVRFAKVRDGEANITLGFRLKVVELGHDPTGALVTSCIVQSTDERPTHRKEQLSEAYAQALEVFRNSSRHHGQPVTVDGFTVTGVTFSDWQDDLVNAGLMDADNAGRQWFLRVRRKLAASHAIGMKKSTAWLTSSARKEEKINQEAADATQFF